MADLAISLATKLIEVVGSTVIREACSTWGYKSQIDNLKKTITTVRNVLLDAESKDGQLGHETKDYIRKLKNAVYDADDLFDEFLTLAQLKQHNKGGKLSEKVRDFFSPHRNSLSVAYSMSREVKKIRKKLDSIASNHNTFGLSGIDSQPIRNRREETCSYVYKDEVIGRDADVKKVVHMLLDSSYEERVSFLSIVGIGGLGKTTLAQLVFNDEQVKREFPLRLWTCVSDEDTKDFDVKKILTNILESVSSDDKLDGLTKESLQRKLRDLLGGKKFLIVLDDLWNEDRNKWLDLKKFLMVGLIESRVLVTTRSKRTAIVVGEDSDKSIYELKGLSPEDSWRLFEMTAFGEKGMGTHNMNFSELVKLGKEIVEKCSNVPLAIRMMGTLLYGQNESKWRSFQDFGLAKLNNGENEIISILKLSYDNLESPLKACFVYCSLFPKDFTIEKEKLIRLWMAQGYILPFDKGQSLEDAAEEYFSILLRRCFFQEVHVNEFGGVYSFKIHDLIHDLAQKLVGNEILSLNSTSSDLGDDVHHIFDLESRREGGFFPKCKIRTYIREDFKCINFPVVNFVETWKFLRTLDLHELNIQALPKSIGELLHLRYLDLSHNRGLKRLPDSITNLYNLQTLDLWGTGLLELPIDLAKLVNLRYLNIDGCHKLSCMPSGLDKLSCLCVLTDFVVGKGKGSLGGLESLLALPNLRGSLQIQIKGDFPIAKKSDKIEERYLGKMKHLETLILDFCSEENQESLLERLEPPSSVKALRLERYKGSELPKNWYGVEGNLATLLPNLIRVKVSHCSNLVHLPSLSKLVHLKSLSLFLLDELEYIQDRTDALPVFPSLEYLELSFMWNLKGWWKRDDVTCNVWQPSFIKLSELKIIHCGNLTSFPNCPNLEKLELTDVSKELLMCLGKEEGLIKLKEVQIDNLDYLKTMPTESLTSLHIYKDNKVESFAEHGETLFMNCSSLRSLRIESCQSLRSINGAGLEHLTSLESVTLDELPKLVLSGPGWNSDSNDDDDDNDNDNNDDDAILWRSFEGSLKSLTFVLLQIKTLPKGLRYLTSLQNLDITWCEKLECLPEWISCLSSLRSLHINGCDALKSLPSNVRDLASLQFLRVWNCPLLAERIQDRDGDDWLNVQHIATVDI